MAIIPAQPILGKCVLKMDDSPIKLTVIIGHGQMSQGGYEIKPNMQSPPISEGVILSGQEITLGIDKDLHKNRLYILMSVAAVLSKQTSFTFLMTGGVQDIAVTVSTDVEEIGDIVSYEVFYKFTKT